LTSKSGEDEAWISGCDRNEPANDVNYIVAPVVGCAMAEREAKAEDRTLVNSLMLQGLH
jgi:hypothetical protein